MKKNIEQIKEKIRDQNKFLRSLLKSFEDIKAGRVSEFKFDKKS